MTDWMGLRSGAGGLALPELLGVLVVVFLAVALALEGLVLLWHGQRSPAARRLRQRLKVWMPELDEGAKARQEAWAAGEKDRQSAVLALRLQQAGWAWTPKAFLSLCAALGLLAALGVLLSIERSPWLPSVAAGLVGALAPMALLERQRRLQLKKLGEQLPDALELMARALRSGHAFSAALQMAAAESPAPIGPALGLVHDQISWGREPDEAFEDLARRAPLDDIRFFVVAVRLQRQTGGRLAEVLNNISAMVRHRMRLQDKVRVLSAEGRLSALVLAAMPVLTAGVIHLIRPDFIAVLWTDPTGLRWLQVSGVLFAAGSLWLWRLTRITV